MPKPLLWAHLEGQDKELGLPRRSLSFDRLIKWLSGLHGSDKREGDGPCVRAVYGGVLLEAKICLFSPIRGGETGTTSPSPAISLSICGDL